MRIKTIKLVDFKRFDNLTIDLGDAPRKIIALVGPNGSGKSSVFDAFEEELKNHKGGGGSSESFLSKLLYSILPERRTTGYVRARSVKIERADGSAFDKKSFYIRSAYRFTPNLQVDSIQQRPDILEDPYRPASSTALDTRLQFNYEMLLNSAFKEFFDDTSTKTGQQVREELLGKINGVLKEILDIKITTLGDVTGGKGQPLFEKEGSKNFPFANLSSGEKEVVDIIIDLIVKAPQYNDTAFCIDEPELHLNTSIQRKLILEIDKLIPENCQLWVATHSIGFLRALQTDLKDKSQILDFSERDYFNGEQTIKPIRTTRANWQRIFKTALEDLTGLIAPEEIIYCEGRSEPDTNGAEQGLDATVYNEIFSEEYHNTLFVSAGGNDVGTNSAVALQIIVKAFSGVRLKLLKDRDARTAAERTAFLAQNTSNRMLERREIENYLFDKEVLKEFCTKNSKVFDETRYDGLVGDINLQDLKPVQQEIQACCGSNGSVSDFKQDLGKVINKNMAIYTSLKNVVF